MLERIVAIVVVQTPEAAYLRVGQPHPGHLIELGIDPPGDLHDTRGDFADCNGHYCLLGSVGGSGVYRHEEQGRLQGSAGNLLAI
jgi:hypothetical protein